MKKTKTLIFIVALLILLVGLSSISATGVSNDTSQTLEKDTSSSVQSVDAPIKNIKKEEQATDLYVSDNTGSDDNSGTNESPYKTIQKALDQTTGESTYNIHIAEGTYKGVGNTNLTVNGNNTINFIGEGINKTVFDGEASYRLHEEGGYYWGSSQIWEPYLDCKGNWIMNITEGTGQISIQNMTITHGMNVGPSSITGWLTSTVNNYGTLHVDNIYFKDNYGGVGAALRNHEEANIYINNSIFEGNRKSGTTGNYGSALFNNGTATIENSLIQKNYARWGTITSDANITVINCTIRDNIGYDGGSYYKYGSGIAVDTGNSDFNAVYDVPYITTKIINSTFIGNDQTDIYIGSSTLLVDNCLFNRSTGIYIADCNDSRITQNITNNIFNDMIASSISTSLSVTSSKLVIINQNGLCKLNIDGNTFIPNKETRGNKVALKLNANATVTRNNITGNIILYYGNNTISNNTINGGVSGSDNLECRDNYVINNWIHDRVVYGDKAVNLNRRNTVENNTPNIGKEYAITEENYGDYFDSDGVMIVDSVEEGSRVYLGNLKSHDLTIKNKNIEILSSEGMILENVTITITGNSQLAIKNLQINSNNQKDYIILLNSTDNDISNCTFNTTTITTPLVVDEKYNSISDCTFNINYSSEDSAEIVGIDIKSDYTDFERNTLNINSDNNNILAIKMFSIRESYLTENNFNLNTAGNMIGIYAKNTTKATFTSTKFISDSTGNMDAIKIDDSEDSIFSLECNIETTGNVTGVNVQRGNNIRLTDIKGHIQADNVMGVIYNNTSNSKIQFVNTPLTITANHTTAVYFNNTYNTSFSSSLNVYVTDNDSSVIKLENSNNNVISPVMDTNINQQIILNNSHNNMMSPSNQMLSSNYTPVLLYNSNNNTITDLNITTIESNDCILLDNSNNNRIINNNLMSREEKGDNTVKEISSTNNTIGYNCGYALITMDNYDEFFNEDNLFTFMQTGTVEIGSDFYGRNFIFDGRYNITNPYNYTLYNASLVLNGEQASLFHINVNSTNMTTVLYVNSTEFTINDSSIYHENDNITRTMVLTNNVNAMICGSTVTTFGPEIATDDGLPSTIAIYDNSNKTIFKTNFDYGYTISEYYTLNYINVTSNKNDGGFIVAYYSDENGYLQYETKTVNTNNYIFFNQECISMPIINMKGNNTTAYYLNKKTMTNHFEGSGLIIMVCLFDSNYSNILMLKNSQDNRVTNLNITTNLRYTITLDNVTNSNISKNHLNSSNTYFAEETILLINSTNIIMEDNRPLPPNVYEITDDNYHEYFDENETFNIVFPHAGITNGVPDNTIRISSDIYNKNMKFNQPVIIENAGNYTIYNATLTTNGGIIHNINLNSTDNRETILNIKGTLNESNIYHYSTTPIKSIVVEGELINNNITIAGPEIETENDISSTIGIMPTIRVKSTVQYNNITVISTITDNKGSITSIDTGTSSKGISIYYNTIKVEAQNNAIIFNGCTQQIFNNKMTVISQNDANIFKINMSQVMMLIQNNTITADVNNYLQVIGIINLKTAQQVRIINNNYTLNSNNTTVFLKVNTINKQPIRINNSNISINSPNLTFTDIINTPYNIFNNSIELTGENIIANKLYDSTENHDFNNNTLTITSTNNSAIYMGDSNTGNNNIQSNTIIIKGNYTQIPPISLTNTKATITDNYILSKYLVGNDAIENNTGLTIANNTPTGNKDLEATITVEPVEITVGEEATIIACVTGMLDNPVNEGKVYFKINGKVLRDAATGKILYADVADGQAQTTITDTARWDEDTLIQAVYVGQKQYADATSEAVNPTITYPEQNEPEFSVADTTAAAGSEVTITVTTKNFDAGKVVLKVNGKTVKADDTKLYAKVTGDTTTFTYTVPKTYKAGEYSIKAVYTSGTARIECEGVLVVE